MHIYFMNIGLISTASGSRGIEREKKSSKERFRDWNGHKWYTRCPSSVVKTIATDISNSRTYGFTSMSIKQEIEKNHPFFYVPIKIQYKIH